MTEYLRAARLYELAHNDKSRAELFRFSVIRKVKKNHLFWKSQRFQKSDLQKKIEVFSEILKNQAIIEEPDPDIEITEGIDKVRENVSHFEMPCLFYIFKISESFLMKMEGIASILRVTLKTLNLIGN